MYSSPSYGSHWEGSRYISNLDSHILRVCSLEYINNMYIGFSKSRPLPLQVVTKCEQGRCNNSESMHVHAPSLRFTQQYLPPWLSPLMMVPQNLSHYISFFCGLKASTSWLTDLPSTPKIYIHLQSFLFYCLHPTDHEPIAIASQSTCCILRKSTRCMIPVSKT